MDPNLVEQLIESWRRFMGNADLPITFAFSNDTRGAPQETTAPHELTFALPMHRFSTLIDNMGESALAGSEWGRLRR